jgi:D-aspartate ligase
MTSGQKTDLNPVKADPSWPAAVIAGAFQTGVLAVRSLKRRGVRAVCFDCNPGYPGFRSVYGPARLAPNPDTDPAGWVRFMQEVAAEMGEKPVLIASADQFVSAIAAHAEILSRSYLLSPGVHLQGLLATKQTQYALAAENGMPLPHTMFVHSLEDVHTFARQASFPCLMKPIHFREWERFASGHPLAYRKIAIASGQSELIENWKLASEVNPSVILQDIIRGEDSDKRVYLSCYNRDGDRIAHGMLGELRCDPIGYGPASVTEPLADSEADELCDRWLRRIGYRGICEIELKRDRRDGVLKMIEANPRLSGSGDAAPYMGVDLCWLHYLDMIGERVVPVEPLNRDFRHIVLRSDARAIFTHLREGVIKWRDVVKSYRRPLAFYDFDPRDWRYSAETILVMARQMVKGILQWVLPGARSS